MRKALLLLLVLALPVLAAQGQVGTVTRPAELRSSPFADGKTLTTLAQGTSVEVVKRTGGWYQVKAAGGAQGWVRMWLLRFSQGSGSAARDSVAMIQSGRSGATYTTATTGVRGLSEEELKNAQPDPAALEQMERLAVTATDARAFAAKGKLQASATP